jgi:hypothetical protein
MSVVRLNGMPDSDFFSATINPSPGKIDVPRRRCPPLKRQTDMTPAHSCAKTDDADSTGDVNQFCEDLTFEKLI